MYLREQYSPSEDPHVETELPGIPIGRVCEGVLDAVGETPLVRLKKYFQGNKFDVLVKMECLNPAGSIKDRPAKRILEHALSTGALRLGGVVIVSSSGNMGIGLAQACRYYGLRFICVVDSKTTEANLQVMRAYGAEIVLVSQPHPATGELLQARIERVEELLHDPGIFLAEPVRQPEELGLALSHHHA